MVAMATSVGVAGFPSLAPSSSDILSKGGNAALSNFPVACTTGILEVSIEIWLLIILRLLFLMVNLELKELYMLFLLIKMIVHVATN